MRTAPRRGRQLFNAVMHVAYGTDAGEAASVDPAWYDAPPEPALIVAGSEYLRHPLSPQQVALYRVVVRDADRFPELGRRYAAQTIGARNALVAGYLERWAVRDPTRVAQTFAALLKAPVFDDVLLATRATSEREIDMLATDAARALLVLLHGDLL